MAWCVVLNPAANSARAGGWLDAVRARAPDATVRLTERAGDGERLAAAAVAEGFEMVVAGGGDGTLNEVLNGILAVPGSSDRVRLGILPMGTVNVMAKELGIPETVNGACDVLERGSARHLDAGWCEATLQGAPLPRRWFLQMAGIGLDARAVEGINVRLKGWIGRLAYVEAFLRAARGPQVGARVTVAGQEYRGVQVIVTNGRYYGGRIVVSETASMTDGMLDVAVIERMSIRFMIHMLCGAARGRMGGVPGLSRFQAAEMLVSGDGRLAVQLEGERAGEAPARIGLVRRAICVQMPAQMSLA